MDNWIYLITGPSGVGKTDIALSWAEANRAEIISCDSLLVYRGMDIGTAKPVISEIERVPHHCIDLVPVRRQFSIGEYIRTARKAVEEISRRGKKILVAGGSGFYLKSFFAPVVDDIEISTSLIQKTNDLYEEEGLEGLCRELKKIDPEGAEGIDLRNARRVINALRRCLASGRTIMQLRDAFRSKPHPFKDYRIRSCCLIRDTDDLRKRIQRRTLNMLARGLVDEVRKLLCDGIEHNPSAASAIGYREAIAFLRNEIEFEELPVKIVRNTMELIRKQRIWFRTQIPMSEELFLSSDTCSVGEDLFR